MRSCTAWISAAAVCALAFPPPGVGAPAPGAPGARTLAVHACQANNRSPYVFVRAKFRPGEVPDPWAVRFFAAGGREVPYFVWDSVTWRVAREGRPDWGNRYALLNHAPGTLPAVLEARGKKLAAAKANLPDLGAELAAEEEAAREAGDSVCAAIYLLRYALPPYGKEKLSLRVYPAPQAPPAVRRLQSPGATAQAGDLRLSRLPDALTVSWKGKELFRYAGFAAGDAVGGTSHVDPAQPYTVEVAEGLVTRVAISGRTPGRQGSSMEWQCTYWLFPEGSYVGLEGFSPGNTAGYQGGEQKLSLWEGAGAFTAVHEPLWEAPWWVYRVGDGGFVATHLWHDLPLAVGYGNNPYTVNPEGKAHGPAVQPEGARLALRWHCSLDDPAVKLIFPEGEEPRWNAKVDWLYRQYAVGVGEKQPEAEGAVRQVIGAGAGWIDRPADEEAMAALMVRVMQRMEARSAVTWDLPLWIAPAVLNPDEARLRDVMEAQRRRPNMGSPGRTEYYIEQLRGNVARGGNPLHARNPQLASQGIPCEGLFDNPAYQACKLPAFIRFVEHFDLPRREDEDRQSLLRYAEYSAQHMAGGPPDLEKLQAAWRSFWPNRTVMFIPLALHAYTLTGSQIYARAAAGMFDDLMAMVETNPHGYPNAWTHHPQAAQNFDTVYNPVSYLRGVTQFWSDGYLDLIGREKAGRFTAAQARYLVFSGQLLDTFEVDKITAICARTHHGHPNTRNQVAQFLYDDFGFYRGLFLDLVRWSAANPAYGRGGSVVSGPGVYRTVAFDYDSAPLLRWALGIGRDTRWFRHSVERQPGKGLLVRLWNGSPWKQGQVSLSGKDLGLSQGDGEALWVQMLAPAYRRPAELEVEKEGEALRVRVTHPMKLRLHYRLLRPDWTDTAKLSLAAGHGAGGRRPVAGTTWAGGYLEWEAQPGEYLLASSGNRPDTRGPAGPTGGVVSDRQTV